MTLVELLLNRFLYKNVQQNVETKDAVFDSSNVIPAAVPAVAAGGSAQDINTGNTTINGGQITPGTIPSTLLDIANWGWGQTLVFSSTNLNTVIWTATGPTNDKFKSADGTTYTIISGTTGVMAAKTYIYFDLNVSNNSYQITTNPSDAVGVGKVLIAVAQNAVIAVPQTNATYNLTEATQIVGDNILANTIDATKITAGSITATQINASYVYAGNISANNVTAGTLTGSIVQTAASGKRIIISSDNTAYFYSANGQVGVIYGDTIGGVETMYLGNTVASGNLFLVTGAGGKVVIGVGTTIKSYFDANGDIHFGGGSGATLDGSSNPAQLSVNKNFVPSADDTYTCGSSGLRWSDVRSASATIGTVITSSGLYLAKLATPPGLASAYTGFMYYDTAATDVVFSNGTAWYKVTATLL